MIHATKAHVAQTLHSIITIRGEPRGVNGGHFPPIDEHSIDLLRPTNAFKTIAFISAFAGFRLPIDDEGNLLRPGICSAIRTNLYSIIGDGKDIAKNASLAPLLTGKGEQSFKWQQYASKAVLNRIRQLAFQAWYWEGEIPQPGYVHDFLLHAVGRAKYFNDQTDGKLISERVIFGLDTCLNYIQEGNIDAARTNIILSSLSEIDGYKAIHGRNLPLLVAVHTTPQKLKEIANKARCIGLAPLRHQAISRNQVTDGLPLFDNADEMAHMMSDPEVEQEEQVVSSASVWGKK
jgi:hypothetical protein